MNLLLPSLLFAPALVLQGCSNGGPLQTQLCNASGSGNTVTLTKSIDSLPVKVEYWVSAGTQVKHPYILKWPAEAEPAKLLVADGIATTVSVGDASTVSVTLHSNIAEYLRMHVFDDEFGLRTVELDLQGLPGKVCDAGASARIVVPEPLMRAEAAGGTALTIDTLRAAQEPDPEWVFNASYLEVRATLGSHVAVDRVEVAEDTRAEFYAGTGSSITVGSAVGVGHRVRIGAWASELMLGGLAFSGGSSTLYASEGSHVSGISGDFIVISAKNRSVVRAVETDWGKLQVKAEGGSMVSVAAREATTVSVACIGGATVNLTGAAKIDHDSYSWTAFKSDGSCRVTVGGGAA